MSGIMTDNFRVFLARQLWKQFQDATTEDNVYLFIARNTPWSDESTPPTPSDTIKGTDYDVWRNMIAAKKIASGDVSFAATRHDWETGTAYAMYRDDSSTLFANSFYVLTSDYNVYKCLDNNNGVVSSVRPTGYLTTPVQTADGYVWQYMYTMSADQALKFLTTTFMPVKELTADDGSSQWTVMQAAANGSIDIVKISSGGTLYGGANGGFVSATSTTATLDASASATSGYYTGSALYVSSGPGAGQVRNITGWNGSTKVAQLSAAWANNPTAASTYVVGPRITATGDGSGFSAFAGVKTGGIIDHVKVITPGTNYSTVTITATGNTGSGASLTGFLPPPGGHGADPVSELSAHNVMMSVTLNGSESSTIMTGNDFRIIGLVMSPTLANTGALANGLVYDQTTHVPIGSITGTFQLDETVTGSVSLATGSIVTSNTTMLRLTNVSGTFQAAETVTGANSAAHATISSTPSNPPLARFSGKPLYIENRGSISRSASQQELIKVVVRF